MEAVEREGSATAEALAFIGTEWRRISGRTFAGSSKTAVEVLTPNSPEAEEGSFSARRAAASFDSWRKKVPSFAANLPAKKLIAALVLRQN